MRDSVLMFKMHNKGFYFEMRVDNTSKKLVFKKKKKKKYSRVDICMHRNIGNIHIGMNPTGYPPV